MTTIVRAALTALAIAGALVGSNTSAFAWGCIAVSEEGSYGYSYNYSSEDGARTKALNECANRTTNESECEIDSCDEDD
ncbi:DUF4189 domain-containing protein [Rhizobium sp. Leaf341]|uniref:DUF4189 domain-containing protein n=1 Tax=Rhizobium sp. Leaf341 TaxID=1736344 RepID=UPI000B20181E